MNNSNKTCNKVTTKSSSLSSSSSSSSSSNRNSSRGVKLINPRRFTVQRLLPARLLTVFRRSLSRVFLRLKTRFHHRSRRSRMIERSSSRRNSFLVQLDEYPYGHGGFGFEYRYRTFVRSNSFYAEAIADCLDFIKRSSVSSVEQNSPSSSPKQGL